MEETTRIPVTKSSGNIFEDLCFENPEEELARADLTIAIYEAVRFKRLSAKKIVGLFNIDPGTADQLVRCRSTDLSTERLRDILRQLEHEAVPGTKAVAPAPSPR